MPNPTIEWRLPHRDAGGPQMPPTSRAEAPIFLAMASMLNGFFVAILVSLHQSRRRHARRIVREHRHLVAAARNEADVPKIAIRRS
ncbi:hypothetical protein [Bradyrhizobium sp. Ash2021]|uniref:hypothetical protein n=1 Tax=Bradyrhizobium sp. Ash2021 TaxID=2954771 RepID=UPI00281528FB|nr:hypothetical protein [Bradyrhizobium sp. Ash2021]WMT75623.1 hypothetical protein NL528_04170 [Bradyrhizobium sp. Ash2021]